MSVRDYKKLKAEKGDGELDSVDGNTKDGCQAAVETTPEETETANSKAMKESCSSLDASLVVTRDYHGLAQTVGGNHSCILVVINRSDDIELKNPVIFAKTGYNRVPPDSRISPSSSGYCAFRKKSIVLSGTSGVISYEYDRKKHTSRRFAVMWKVPYRVVNREENEVAIKWLDVNLDDTIDSNTHTSLELYQEMSGKDEATESEFPTVRGMAKDGKTLQIVNPDNGAELDATFSGSCKAIVKLEFHFSAA